MQWLYDKHPCKISSEVNVLGFYKNSATISSQKIAFVVSIPDVQLGMYQILYNQSRHVIVKTHTHASTYKRFH